MMANSRAKSTDVVFHVLADAGVVFDAQMAATNANAVINFMNITFILQGLLLARSHN
jgi:hypothetical protein